jgi:putative transposase
MKSSRYTEEQIIGILKQHQAGLGAKELCRKYGISDATFYQWRSKYGGMEVSDGAQAENPGRGEPQAQEAAGRDGAGCCDAEGDAGKKLLTPRARRVAVSWAIKDKGYTQRRACRLVGQEPKTYRYASKRPDDDALRQRLKELASQRKRFGYRRLHLLLRREGVLLNWKKLYRLYREERLTVRKRGGRKRALGTRAPMTIPQGRD